MIITREIDKTLHRHLLKNLCCPVCLSDLVYVQMDEKKSRLQCDTCKNSFSVVDGLPYFLIEDENVKKKADEIYGEETYNTKTIPQEVHNERNSFVNRNTDIFLQETGLDLTGDEVLIVGCSIAELDLFAKKSKQVTALDIVPALVQGCVSATAERGIPANWVCGDGECLPFEDESFDTVIVRQTLHHMLKYYSAICEFFRVCKRGGYVLIIDEPFSPPDVNDLLLKSLPDKFALYRKIEFKRIRKKLKIPRSPTSQKIQNVDIRLLETNTGYIEPDRGVPESFLADKYHAFSLLNCILALRLHTEKITLNWPKETAWTDESGEVVRFCHGPNRNYNKSLLGKLTRPGNVSIVAEKTKRTTVRRNRSDLKALPVDMVLSSNRLDTA